MTTELATVLVLAAVTLMLLAAVDKRRLVFNGQRRCKHCHRERRYCSCPDRRRSRTT